MADTIHTLASTRKEQYAELLPQVKGLLEPEENTIANLANLAAVLKTTFDFHWVGFYMVQGKELVLGPFQGPVACTRLQWGRGVCAAAWEEKKVQVVPDVDAFAGHVACSPFSKSELVLPLFNKEREVWTVLDIDSSNLNDFSEVDVEGLKALTQWL